MKNYLDYAKKELKNQKAITIIMILAIILSTTMITVIGQAVYIMKNVMVNQAKERTGDYHVLLTKMSENQGKSLWEEKEINTVSVCVSLGTKVLKENGVRLYFNEFPTKEDQINAGYGTIYQLTEGRLPEAPNEIALDSNTLKLLKSEASLGGSVKIEGIQSNPPLSKTGESFDFSGTFIVTGILKDDFRGYSSSRPYVNTIIGMGTCDKIGISEDYRYTTAKFKVNDLYRTEEIVDCIFQKLKLENANKERLISYNSEYLTLLGATFKGSSQTVSADVLRMGKQVLLIVVLILGAAGLVVYNVMKLFTLKRVTNYGILAALGARKQQIWKIVLWESVFVSLIGMGIGIILGIFLTKGLLKFVLMSGINTAMFLTDSKEILFDLIQKQGLIQPIVILLVLCIVPMSVVLATMPSAKMAAKSSPIEVIEGVKQKTNLLKGKRLSLVNRIERNLAKINLLRNKKSSFITIVSLIIGVTIFIILNAYTSTLNLSSDVEKNPDIYLSNSKEGISEAILDYIDSNGNILQVMTKSVKTFDGIKDSEEFSEISNNITFPSKGYVLNLIGLDENYLQYLNGSTNQDILTQFAQGKVCFINGVRSEFGETNTIKNGDTIILENHTFNVTGMLEGYNCVYGEAYLLGIDVYVSNRTFKELVKDDSNTNANEIDLFLKKGSDTPKIVEEIEKIAADSSNTKVLSTEEGKKQAQESFQKTKIITWGFIGFILFISILNLINTTYTNIQTTRNEAGILRALGMSSRNLRKMYLWQNLWLSMIASLVGGVIGISGACYLLLTNDIQIAFVKNILVPFVCGSITTIIVCCIFSLFFTRNLKKKVIVNEMS